MHIPTFFKNNVETVMQICSESGLLKMSREFMILTFQDLTSESKITKFGDPLRILLPKNQLLDFTWSSIQEGSHLIKVI